MGFVTVKRGNNDPIRVSSLTYERHLKNKGYRIVSADKPKQILDQEEVKQETPIFDEVEETNEDDGKVVEEEVEEIEEENIDSIPISEMNKKQLAEYAKLHNIDTSKAKNVREAREIIQEAIKESKLQ